MLVLDLDETLVHASLEQVPHDTAFVVEIGNQKISVFLRIRPYCVEFLRRMGQLFEVVLFTASLAPYAEQVIDLLDPLGVHIHHRLFRDHCTLVDGNYVKDLALLGRSMERICIVDNSPAAYAFHPRNALPIRSWFDDPDDVELLKICPTLEQFARTCDVYATPLLS